MKQFSLVNMLFPDQLLNPAADAAGRTGSYKAIAGASKFFIVYHITQGNAATITLAPQQAQGTGGTGAKAITTAKIYTVEDLSVAGWTFTQPPDGASYTTGAGTKNKLVVFECDPADALDVNNGFNAVAAQTGASNSANITAAMLYAALPYAGASGQGQD